MIYAEVATTGPIIGTDVLSTSSSASYEYNEYPITIVEPQINVVVGHISVQAPQQRKD